MNIGQRAPLPAMFGAVDVGTDIFKWQRTVDEYHLAIGLVGHPLRLQVKGFHKQPVVGHARWRCRLVRAFSHKINFMGDPTVMPGGLGRLLTGRQIFGRINRFTLSAHFKMQFDVVRITAAHLGNFLAF